MKKCFYLLNLIWDIFFSIMLFALSIYINIYLWGKTEITEKIIVILMLLILITFYISLLISKNISLKSKIVQRSSALLFISIITLNVFLIIFMFKFLEKGERIRIRKIKTFDIIAMGIILALFLFISFLASFIPTIPFMFDFPFHLIPLLFFAFISDIIKTFFLSLLCGLCSWFMPNNADAGVSFVAFTFDYLLPIISVTVATLIQPKSKNVFEWLCFIIVPVLLGYCSKVMSGVLYWFNPAYGWSKWSYSIIFNLFNLSSHLILLSLTIPTICETTRFLKEKYYR